MGSAQTRFLEFMRAPLTVLTTRCEQLVRFEVSGDESAEQETTLGGKGYSNIQWDDGPKSGEWPCVLDYSASSVEWPRALG